MLLYLRLIKIKKDHKLESKFIETLTKMSLIFAHKTNSITVTG